MVSVVIQVTVHLALVDIQARLVLVATLVSLVDLDTVDIQDSQVLEHQDSVDIQVHLASLVTVAHQDSQVIPARAASVE